MVNFGEVWRAPLAKSSLLTSMLVPIGIFSDLLMPVQMLKREWGAESNGKLSHLLIPSKTATFVPEFAMGDLPLSRTATLVPAFAVQACPWAEHSADDEHCDTVSFSRPVAGLAGEVAAGEW